MGIHREDEGGLQNFSEHLDLDGEDKGLIPNDLIRRDDEGTVITYFDDTGRLQNYNYTEGSKLPDHYEHAKLRTRSKLKDSGVKLDPQRLQKKLNIESWRPTEN